MSKRYAGMALLCLAACSQPERPAGTPAAQPVAAGRERVKTAAAPERKEEPSDRYNTQHGNQIVLHFGRGQDRIAVRGTLGKPGTTVRCEMELNANQRLSAQVEATTGPANIRINRVVFPDGQSDGPFGKTLDYRTKQQGIYTLEIGASLMADNAYEGPFELTVTVK